jgi:hypothetical protein
MGRNETTMTRRLAAKLLVALTLTLGCHGAAAPVAPTASLATRAEPAAAPQRSGLMPVACHDAAPASPAAESGTCSLEEETP